MRGLVSFILILLLVYLRRSRTIAARTSLTNLPPGGPSGRCRGYQVRFLLLCHICQVSRSRFAWCSLCHDRAGFWLRFRRVRLRIARLASLLPLVWNSVVQSARGLILRLHGFGNSASVCRNKFSNVGHSPAVGR